MKSSSGEVFREPPVQRVQYRYGTAFKLQVVSEIESGQRGYQEARRHYGIGGGYTIQKWEKRMGKNHLLSKVVRVESPEDRDQTKVLQAKVRELESALAQTQVRLLAYESLVEVAEEYTGLDLKKLWSTSVVRAESRKEECQAAVTRSLLCSVFGHSRQGLILPKFRGHSDNQRYLHQRRTCLWER